MRKNVDEQLYLNEFWLQHVTRMKHFSVIFNGGFFFHSQFIYHI